MAGLGGYARADRPVADRDDVSTASVLEDPSALHILVGRRRIRLIDRRLVGADWLRAPAPSAPPPPRFVFASLKGGVGRSTALAVVAAHLASRGKRVLAIDLDLEAPGLAWTLLADDTLPPFGILDALVENNLSGLDAVFMADMVGPSALAHRAGRIDVIPAFGRRSIEHPADVLAKLARAYAEDIRPDGSVATILDQVRAIVDQTLLVVYDALDTVATTWPRRRLLTEALLEVAWAMRAYRAVKLKLFLRPDQLNDDALRFVELPKQRTGAVRLTWSTEDLYGLFFSRLAMGDVRASLRTILGSLKLPSAQNDEIRTRQWSLAHDRASQVSLMSALAGPFMGEGTFGHKKGKTYDWPISHLGDAFEEVTPRSFLGLMIAAAQYGVAPPRRAITPDGIRHGLRAASRTRVDQLHQEFPWIKGVLAPLDGLLLPQEEKKVFAVWK